MDDCCTLCNSMGCDLGILDNTQLEQTVLKESRVQARLRGRLVDYGRQCPDTKVKMSVEADNLIVIKDDNEQQLNIDE